MSHLSGAAKEEKTPAGAHWLSAVERRSVLCGRKEVGQTRKDRKKGIKEKIIEPSDRRKLNQVSRETKSIIAGVKFKNYTKFHKEDPYMFQMLDSFE